MTASTDTEARRWGDNLSAEQWRELAAKNLEAAHAERELRLAAEKALERALGERAAVVEWLRAKGANYFAQKFADEIESGAHLTESPKP